MKLFLLAALMLTSTVSFATAVCPEGSNVRRICKSSPKAGDHEFAIGLANSVAICSEGTSRVLILEKNGISDELPVQEIVRAGATTYVANVDMMNISFTTIVNRKLEGTGILSVKVESAEIDGSATYTCK